MVKIIIHNMLASSFNPQLGSNDEQKMIPCTSMSSTLCAVELGWKIVLCENVPCQQIRQGLPPLPSFKVPPNFLAFKCK